MKTVTAEFSDRAAAQWAVYDLYRNGVPRHTVSIEPIGADGHTRVTAWALDKRHARRAIEIMTERGATKIDEPKRGR